jgi:hypothetical protein
MTLNLQLEFLGMQNLPKTAWSFGLRAGLKTFRGVITEDSEYEVTGVVDVGGRSSGLNSEERN